MSFKKILLATAIAAVSTSSFAMQSMDDESLSASTGQAGLTINIDNANLAAFSMIVHDTDGFTTGNTFDGGIMINNIDVGQLDLTIDVDAGATGLATTDATLQAKIYNGTAISVALGTLTVGNSNRDLATPGWGVSSQSGTLADLGTLSIGVTTSAAPLLTIQMGNEPQGAWMKLKPVFGGGLSLTNFTLYDSTTAALHGIRVGTLLIDDNGAGTDLTADISIDATANGLVLTTTALGSATGMDLRMTDVRLGTVANASSSIGDVEIVGLNLNATTIAISGH